MKITILLLLAGVLLAGCAKAPVVPRASTTQLHDAVIRNDAAAVQAALKSGTHVNSRDYFGDTPLHYSAALNRPEITRLLLQSGANANSRNNKGDTSLHQATQWNKLEIAKQLVEQGANVNAQNNDGRTPLMLACGSGFTDLARLFVARQADLALRDKDGKTAQDIARENSQTETLNFILVASAPPPPEPAKPEPVSELDALVAGKDIPGLKVYLDAHPDAQAKIKDDSLRLLMAGPAALRVVDIVDLLKAGKKEVLIIAQIRDSGGYGPFSVAEADELKKLGFSAAMLAAMTEEKVEPPVVVANQPPVVAPVPVQVQAAPQENSQPAAAAKQQDDNAAAECLKLAAAIKACDHGSSYIPFVGSLVANGCKAAAKSKFNCTLPLEEIMR